ncbi:hypothetical protein ACVGVM_11210 [Pseudonocardia bannensis]|uniref:Uncharacterized protein n=1 Tax=Pseudonocardia bannensis TaxID=630973 RepID=A0A848DR82_9PSEU|nr:hypothetical protein [Pseudonocardia bannensis]NMH95009.1 hypothetical protein [Pseudonocardia bannensis]
MHRSAALAPFIVWLASRDPDEAARRRHRDQVERYLRWADLDRGPARGRRERYERLLRHVEADPAAMNAARTALDRYAEFQQILALTAVAD